MTTPYRIGVDIGGTFTDFALLDERCGGIVVHKQLTTPADPSLCILDGIDQLLAKAGVAIDAVSGIVHGMTLVTNALPHASRCAHRHAGHARLLRRAR